MERKTDAESREPERQPKLENQLCFPLYACARKIVNLYTPYLRKSGITYTQYLVLMVLWEQDGIPVGDLCRRLYLDCGTMTPLLKNLEKAGFLSRSRSREDERVVRVQLTERGKAMRSAIGDVPSCVGQSVPLNAAEAGELYRLLYKILNAEPGR